jgi:arginase
MPARRNIQVIVAPSILGLKPNGVERLASTLLSKDLIAELQAEHAIIEVPSLNHLYDGERAAKTILNGDAVREFSLTLSKIIHAEASPKKFLLVLGGDCSILIGIMLGLKSEGTFGLFFLDGHADFYDPKTSITGEAADMDLALVTGRGPEILTNINEAGPYVHEEHVIHLGQRDLEETIRYNAKDIRQTKIKCIDASFIREHGIKAAIEEIQKRTPPIAIDGYWIHFDTDVLDDASNPAVDYRLPGGLSIEECQLLLTNLISNYNIVGMTVTIYNPSLDPHGNIARTLTNILKNAIH